MIIYAYTVCNIQQVYLIVSHIVYIFLQPASCVDLDLRQELHYIKK